MAGSAPRASGDGPKKARIEIIPLIDVIFFLLATFVLFTLSLDKIASIPVTLPAAQPTQPTNNKDYTTIFLQVSESNIFYWKKGSEGIIEQISLSELAPRLQSYVAQESEDPQTCTFLIWALDEQTAAERELTDYITMLRRLSNDGMLVFDNQLGE